MRLTRVYYSNNLNVGESIPLDSDSAHYLINVLRLKQDQEIVLFNGNDGDVLGTIATITKKELTIDLNAVIAKPLDAGLKINLALGLSKGDRMDYAIQKSVELGVSEISPLYTEFSEVKFKESKRLANKLRHWQRISISACEQCGAHEPAIVNEPVSLNSFLENDNAPTKLVLDVNGETEIRHLEIADSVSLLVGPEGGLSAAEIELSQTQGYTSVSLGPRILRTETAPVAAIAILQNL